MSKLLLVNAGYPRFAKGGDLLLVFWLKADDGALFERHQRQIQPGAILLVGNGVIVCRDILEKNDFRISQQVAVLLAVVRYLVKLSVFQSIDIFHLDRQERLGRVIECDGAGKRGEPCGQPVKNGSGSEGDLG